MKQAPLDLSEPHATVLCRLLESVPPEEIPWALTGSAGLRLQGVDLPVNDLDVQTRGEFIAKIEHRLQAYVIVPVREWITGNIRSLDGKAVIDGVQIEFLAEFAFRGPDGRWQPPTDVVGLRTFLSWRGNQVPVLPLEHEAESYEKMGRMDTATLILETLAAGKE